jgi:hypothetical protein
MVWRKLATKSVAKLKIVLLDGGILATCLLKHRPKITQEFIKKNKQDKLPCGLHNDSFACHV